MNEHVNPRGKIVNKVDLASIFGVSLPTIDQWLRSGCPFDQRGGLGREWQFAAGDVLRWRCERAAAISRRKSAWS